ncbi:MAG: hypothetical protein K0S76_764 [Herbinix sp.]|jgi:hypothetical protein|nr:hypothetical protein [Herbinix sp.]
MRAMTQTDKVEIYNKLTVTTEELQALLSLGRQSAVEIGMKAEARVPINKKLLWNVKKIRDYLDKISE